MKKGSISNRSFFSNAGKPARKPLRTFMEMAEEFGVSRNKLAQALGTEGAPKYELKNFGGGWKITNTWYEPIAMRKWWKERTEKTGKAV